jgi:hypothetical protein
MTEISPASSRIGFVIQISNMIFLRRTSISAESRGRLPILWVLGASMRIVAEGEMRSGRIPVKIILLKMENSGTGIVARAGISIMTEALIVGTALMEVLSRDMMPVV